MMRGNGRVEQYKGNIVGFSNRLNTILVPESFMVWANKNFAPEAEAQPSRLIIEVGNPADASIAKYFQQKGYETEDGKLDAGKTTYFPPHCWHCIGGGALYQCTFFLYIDVKHLPSVAKKHYQARKPIAYRLQPGKSSAPLSDINFRAKYSGSYCIDQPCSLVTSFLYRYT